MEQDFYPFWVKVKINKVFPHFATQFIFFFFFWLVVTSLSFSNGRYSRQVPLNVSGFHQFFAVVSFLLPELPLLGVFILHLSAYLPPPHPLAPSNNDIINFSFSSFSKFYCLCSPSPKADCCRCSDPIIYFGYYIVV